MCGIVGYIGQRDCAEVLVDGLEKLEYRGYDSAGIAIFENGSIKVVKTKGRLRDMEAKMQREGTPSGHCGIGHTRWATHGEPSDANSHPHGNGRITIVHNGIIENYRELKQFLAEHGYVFESETDSETVAKLLDYYYEGDPLATLQRVLPLLQGSYALGIIFKDFPRRIYAVRKDSPLIAGVGEGESFIASDVPAILKYTRKYILLEQNEIAVLNDEGICVFDVYGHRLEKEQQLATWDVEAAEKGGFPHFMLKEIHEQPTAIRNTVGPRVKDGMADLSEAGLTDELLRGIGHIWIVACGTAMHAGMVGKYAIESLARIPVTVDIASEFRYRRPILNKNDLVVIISQSGETADTLAALRLAKGMGVHTLAVVNVVGSSIPREADHVLYTHAGPEIAVASTKAYSVQLAVMYLLGLRLGYVKGTLPEDECKRLTALLQQVPGYVGQILASCEDAKYIAAQLVTADSLFFIGRGLDNALSMEGSLKLKEISYIHSEAYAAGELKHGTISLITDNMPVVAVATQRALFDKMVSNIKEVKARGAMVILLCHENAPLTDDVADYVLKLPSIDDLLMPLIAAVSLQLLAYYASVLRGCDVDKPRNLAKSVTVE